MPESPGHLLQIFVLWQQCPRTVGCAPYRTLQANTENSRGIVLPLVRLLGDLPAATGRFALLLSPG